MIVFKFPRIRSLLCHMLILNVFPRELSEEQKNALAAEITEVLIRHLSTKRQFS